MENGFYHALHVHGGYRLHPLQQFMRHDRRTYGLCVCVSAGIGSLTTNILPNILMLVPKPTPNPEALIRKSPEYVSIYTIAYQKRCNQLRKRPTIWGGGVPLTAFAISAIWLYHYSLNSGDLPEVSH
ncbi:MAG: hypothetical protein OXN27_19510 [Candidatus Poribacteria bacterium]|nr:hypothetical protein [Candidatus Poribacteria bacterium]